MSGVAPETTTFLFADLAGFTALTEAHGDEQAADLVQEFASAVDELLSEHEAQRVKTIGDALMVRCADAGRAVRLGAAIAEQVGARDRFPGVRVGMNTGPATERDGDFFGAAVNVAARVTGLASAGEALLTEATKLEAGEQQEVRLFELGRKALRNVGDPVLLFRARGAASAAEPGLPIDPVCRMAVEPSRSAGTLHYEGTDYEFCSIECVRAFSADPARYVETDQEQG
jgi:adenylate cyclase